MKSYKLSRTLRWVYDVKLFLLELENEIAKNHGNYSFSFYKLIQYDKPNIVFIDNQKLVCISFRFLRLQPGSRVQISLLFFIIINRKWFTFDGRLHVKGKGNAELSWKFGIKLFLICSIDLKYFQRCHVTASINIFLEIFKLISLYIN